VPYTEYIRDYGTELGHALIASGGTQCRPHPRLPAGHAVKWPHSHEFRIVKDVFSSETIRRDDVSLRGSALQADSDAIAGMAAMRFPPSDDLPASGIDGGPPVFGIAPTTAGSGAVPQPGIDPLLAAGEAAKLAQEIAEEKAMRENAIKNGQKGVRVHFCYIFPLPHSSKKRTTATVC
jgi:hypothetical protein